MKNKNITLSFKYKRLKLFTILGINEHEKAQLHYLFIEIDFDFW